MRVHLIRKETIEEFMAKHPDSIPSFQYWVYHIKYADWKEPGDIKKIFSSADLLGAGSERVVFDISGNNFRMICAYNFGKTMVHLYVKWIGTHAAYTRLCDKNDQYSVNSY